MKAHIGVDAATGLVHSLVSTAANVQDVTQAHALLHGEESTVFADAGYVGAQKREENQDTAGNGKSLCGRANAKPYQIHQKENCWINWST